MKKIKSTLFAFLLVFCVCVCVACGKDDVKGGDGGNGGNEVSDSGSVSDTTNNNAGSYDGEIDWEW